jgi:hypothetical protein
MGKIQMSLSWVYTWFTVDSLGEDSAEKCDLCFLYVFFHNVNNYQREYFHVVLMFKNRKKGAIYSGACL